MSESILAHFDGRVIVPDDPLELAPGQRLRIRVETVESDAYPLAQIGQLAVDMGVSDLADRHQHYARLTRKDSPGV